MRKNFTFCILLSLIIFYTFTNSSDNVSTGQSWASCGGCHTASTGTIVDSIKLINLATGAEMTGFYPDSIYKIRMVAHNTSGTGTYPGFGFQLRAVNGSGSSVGSYNGTLPANTGNQGSGILTHSNVLSPTGGNYIVEVNWKAPTSATTSVNLQSVVNAVNSNGQSTGDAYSNSIKTVTYNILGLIGALNCGSGSTTGTLTSTIVASGVSFSIPYTGGNGGSHSGQTVNSTGVTGLTATLSAGSFTTSTGNLVYNVTGTPASAGTASFALNIGTKTCTYTITVTAPLGTISSLNCASGTITGTLTNGSAASGVSFTIPYTGGNTGTYTAQNISSIGVTGLTANIAAGNFANGAGNLNFTVTGTPTSAGTASFPITIGGQSCTFTFTVNPIVGTITSLNCNASKKTGTLVATQAASGVSDTIPYTGGNAGVHSGQIVNSTGVTGLQAGLPAGSFASGSGNVIYSISGTPTSAGKAIFAFNIGGKNCTDTFTVVPPVGTISSLNCSGGTTNGTLSVGVAASGVSFSVPYTGGNAGTHNGQIISSTGVTGLSAKADTGLFANGSGNLIYNVTGTPTGVGTASFALNIGGANCTYTINITAGTIAALNCASGITIGSIVNGASSVGSSFKIPYTGGNGNSHSGQIVNSTGITGLTATLSGGSFVNGNDTVTYTLSGTPNGIGNANFALNIGGKTCTYIISVVAGAISNLDCSGGATTGSLQAAVTASGVSFMIPYTGGNGGAHNGQIVTSNGVTGLTAKLDTSTFANGTGTLVYNISGTPNVAGSADFTLNIGGKSCLYSVSVAPPVGVITALNCNNGTTFGTLNAGTAASSVSFNIPYTGGNKGTYNTQSISSTGVLGLTASMNNGLLSNGSGTLTFTVSGTPTSAGNAVFSITIGGKNCSYTLVVNLQKGSIGNLDCSTATSTGTLNASSPASGVTFTVPYTGGNGGLYSALGVASTGVTGLTANSVADTFANGDSVIKFTVTGTPSTFGTANFKILIGGDSCDYSMPVLYPLASVSTLNCSSGTTIDTLIKGASATNVSFTIPYTGGNRGTYVAQAINSTGVTGLTATLSADTLKLGNGTLTYIVSGTPSNTGTANFAINMGGKSCSYSIPVILPIGLINNLDCDSAKLFRQEPLMATIPFTGVSFTVPYKGGNGGSYTAQSISSINVSGLTASTPTGVFNNGDGFITFTVTGTPNSSGNADFIINLGNKSCMYSVPVLPLLEGTVSSLDCHLGKINGTPIEGKSTTGVTMIIYYDGGNRGYILPQSIPSVGVTGLTANIGKTQLAIGYGQLTYNITGTPSAEGIASFPIQIGNKVCNFNVNVRSSVGKVGSLYCGNGSTSSDITVGTINQGINFKIPYDGSNGGPYTAQTISSQTVTGLTANLPAGVFNIGAGELTYTLSGTTTKAGNALFTISFGNVSCIYAVKINAAGSSIHQINTDLEVYQHSNIIYIKNLSHTSTYQLLDISGKVIKKGLLGKNDSQIDLKNLPKGILFMKLENEKGYANYKFNVE